MNARSLTVAYAWSFEYSEHALPIAFFESRRNRVIIHSNFLINYSCLGSTNSWWNNAMQPVGYKRKWEKNDYVIAFRWH